MRTLLITLCALLVGFAAGMALSEAIGIVGVLGFGRMVGIKYLPVYLALGLALLANIADHAVRWRDRKE